MTLGIIFALWFLFSNTNEADKIVYSDLVTMFEKQEVKSFEVDEKDNIIITKHDGSDPVKYKLRDFAIFYNDFSDLINEQVNNGIIEKFEYTPYKTTPWWVSLLPTIGIGILFFVVWICVISLVLFTTLSIYSGVVPQQPPTAPTPSDTSSATCSENSSGVRSYTHPASVIFGSPALGLKITGREEYFR